LGCPCGAEISGFKEGYDKVAACLPLPVTPLSSHLSTSWQEGLCSKGEGRPFLSPGMVGKEQNPVCGGEGLQLARAGRVGGEPGSPLTHRSGP
jgi:hypothetical protein